MELEPLGTRAAILKAMECVKRDTSLAEGERDRVWSTLDDIIQQEGCEELDPCVKDGRLTTYMDLVIFG
jgi:hypothetical protein